MFQLSPEGEEERDTCRPLTVGTSQVTRQAETEADTGVTHLHSILLQRQGKQLRGGGTLGVDTDMKPLTAAMSTPC